MYTPTKYHCMLTERLLDKEYIKGPFVDLRLIDFYDHDLDDAIPYYWFEIMVGSKPVGKISLRLGFNETSLVNGQVGYEVLEMYQGHHYSYYALEMVKSLAREHGFSHLLITTTQDNVKSQHIIHRANGKLIIENYEVPKDHIFYVIGKPRMQVYEITL